MNPIETELKVTNVAEPEVAEARAENNQQMAEILRAAAVRAEAGELNGLVLIVADATGVTSQAKVHNTGPELRAILRALSKVWDDLGRIQWG